MDDDQLLALMRANLHDVFGQRDPQARRAVAERIYTQDVEFSDDEGVVTGWDGITGKAQAVLGAVPADFVFAEDGPFYAAGDEVALAWTFGPDGGEPAVRGIDIGTITGGRISRMRTLLAR
ncbi:nuclear transport factor 2 family protein [Kineosporia sp. J2-2]|uniref:Nuclear transport factor 2 family protein n=1 Tax=Kineosporia corallincola TaxID=2835133 RepID=A0ABS5TQQ5_9ACTN|nr:nuclear transport factor 2 family protein [Kineosporia corallincola]MBT0772528.1 nuclear transport factor 2 family protein [Kineosporia corallincola]